MSCLACFTEIGVPCVIHEWDNLISALYTATGDDINPSLHEVQKVTAFLLVRACLSVFPTELLK